MARIGLLIRVVLICLLSVVLIAGSIYIASAAPEGGAVRAGSAQISQQGSSTLIRQSSPRAVIDWRSFGINAGERVQFAQPSSTSATLNRVTGEPGLRDPGPDGRQRPGSADQPQRHHLRQGRPDQRGQPDRQHLQPQQRQFHAGQARYLTSPASPGRALPIPAPSRRPRAGLIALVAPHVRNDGMIQARLGKVILGAADTFTIDFYGDGLINLALSEASLSQLKDAQGEPLKSLIEQAGTIDVSGGKAVLVTRRGGQRHARQPHQHERHDHRRQRRAAGGPYCAAWPGAAMWTSAGP